MPIEGNTLKTKMVNVKQRQELLYVIHNEPWAVEKMWINERGEVMAKMHDVSFSIAIGDLKDKYCHLLGYNKLHIRSWQTTGGETLPGFISDRGHLLSYIGLNLVIILTPGKPTNTNSERDGIEQEGAIRARPEPSREKAGVH